MPKIAHITARTNHHALRDPASIYPETFVLFRPLIQPHPVAIPRTPFLLKTTIDEAADGAAAFDLMLGDSIALTNFCSFTAVGAANVMPLVRQLCKKFGYPSPRQPESPKFLYSIAVGPAPPEAMMLAGEIEFYIYETIRRHGYAED